MKNLKTKGIFTFLFVLTIFLTLSLGNVFAVDYIYIPVNLTVKDPSGSVVKNGADLGNIKAGDKITVTASCENDIALLWSQNPNFMADKGFKYNDKGMALLSYMFDSTNKNDYKQSSDPTQVTITIPNYEAGSQHYLVINAVAACDGLPVGEKEYQATSGTFAVKFTMIKEKLTGDIAVKHNGKTLASGSETTISVGDKAVITASPEANFSNISGTWQINNNAPTNLSFSGASTTLDIPGVKGQTIKLTLTGTLKDGGKTSTKTYLFKIPAEVVPLTGSVVAKNGSTELTEGSKNELPTNTQITLSGSPTENFTKITYKWDNDAAKDISGANGKITVPNFEAGSEHTLTVTGTLKDGTIVSQKVYKIKIPAASVEPIPDPDPDDEKLTGSIVAKINGNVLSNNSTNTVVGDEIIEIAGDPVKNFSSLKYKWDGGSEKEVSGGTASIDVLAEEGYTHTLKVYGILADGGKTSTKIYNFIVEEDDELIVESWMRENSDAEGLIVSLRNDSEEDKANKNFYEIEEEVIYYVDYKNCGKDINNEVKLVLELPLKFSVVNSAAGTISKTNKTITWTFANGLEEGQSGTKEVVIKYTALTKSSYDYEIIYPKAVIYEKTKKKDASAVINYIYLSESTVIEDEHEPYMFGDKDAPTFRPDDTITRAEGALVLTRIFGIKTASVKVTNTYSDIQETYLEAQKAIVAASNLGIINGYSDGTYRPNEKMTRAEFMKIIASYIEILGDEKNIDGLEVKEDANIKVYKNSVNKNHWAINYVTLLVRLNMTSVSKSNKDLRLDDGITRAEVAQLVNFYLLRAPAKISSSTKIEFIDVARNHALIEDIIEATREEHKFVITADGKERAK